MADRVDFYFRQRVTEVGKEYDTHHVMLDFGTMPFPVLEGQSIGIIAPGEALSK